MAQRGRKYNIWIAYADLFTNLTAFLFISAIGLFAGLGSGRLSMAKIGGEQQNCRMAPGAAGSLTQPGSLIVDQPVNANLRPPCTQFFRIGRFSFDSPDADLRHFRNGGTELKRRDVLRSICQPIWQTISRRDFVNRGGRLAFWGIGRVGNVNWHPALSCPLTNPPRGHGLLNLSDRQIARLRACRNHPTADPTVDPSMASAAPWPTECRSVRDCFDAPGEEPCRQMEALFAWDDREVRTCHTRAVREQAAALRTICEGAPFEYFQGRIFSDNPRIYVDEARDARRATLWERVDVRGHVTRADQPSALDGLMVGTVVLEVQYTR